MKLENTICHPWQVLERYGIIMSDLKAKSLHMGPAQCAVDLGDGSERGEYVNQDYILQKLGRPHRAINLMYCYYPNDEGWPGRASVVHAAPSVQFAWDFPYDDYFTYKGGLNGTRDDEPFTCMRDVRRHGQDVLLTMTIDPKVSDVKSIIWLDGCKSVDEEKMEMEDIFAEASRAADIVSVDRYMSLHWGWPYDVAEEGGDTFSRSKVEDIYALAKKSYERYTFVNGGTKKPMVLSEFNSDGDVTGPYDQADMLKSFCEMLKADKEKWLSGFTLYQFRDRGRLGLEIEDPNNAEVGIEQPLMDTYREIIHDDFFQPSMETGEELALPATLRWGGSEDADGVAVPLHFDSDPVFCEAYFDEDTADMNLMLELNGQWFYKAPGVKCVDMMSAFFKNRLGGAADMELKIFAPPASGENDPSQGEDWQTNYYTELKALPTIRIRYAPIAK